MNQIFFTPTVGAASYVIESGPTSTGSWSAVATVTGAIPGDYYSDVHDAMRYEHDTGTSSTWYRVAAVDTNGATGSYSDAFQADASYVVSLARLDDLKAYLGITSTADDGLLARLIAAASRWFVNQCGRPIAQTVYTEDFSGDGGTSRVLRHDPATRVLSVSVDGAPVDARASVTGAGYVLRGQLLDLVSTGSFSAGVQNCGVVYVAGHEPVPEDVQQAVIEYAALLYRQRTRVGEMSKTMGGEVMSFQTISVPFSVQLVVDSYRRLPL